jgi:hypothetical protein
MVLEGIAAKAAIGLGSLAAVWLGPKIVGPAVRKLLAAQLVKGLDPKTADPVEKECIKSITANLIRLAEHRLPDRGNGDAKKKLVVAALQKYLPGAAADAIGALVQEVFDAADDELKQAGRDL